MASFSKTSNNDGSGDGFVSTSATGVSPSSDDISQIPVVLVGFTPEKEEEEHINWLSLTPPPFSIIVDTYGATFVKFMAYINDQEYQKD